MERHQIIEMMRELKLDGMRALSTRSSPMD